MTDPATRLALRPAGEEGARLDDVVVRNVDMFRAEVLADDVLWIALYLPGTGVEGDRVTFRITVEGGGLRLEVEELPGGQVTYEDG